MSQLEHLLKDVPQLGVRQMQTADLQTRAWVSQTRTSVSQTSASYRYRYIGIGIGIGIYSIYPYILTRYIIYQSTVCSLHMSHTAHNSTIPYNKYQEKMQIFEKLKRKPNMKPRLDKESILMKTVTPIEMLKNCRF